jgi:hypothetical protein
MLIVSLILSCLSLLCFMAVAICFYKVYKHNKTILLDFKNEFAKELQAGNAVSVSSDVLSSGIFEDGIVSEELSNCTSFLAVPLEMMGMLLGVLFLGFEIEIGEEFDQVKDMLIPYMTKLKEALG